MDQIKNLKTGIKYKDTPIGKMPVDWKASAFSELADINPKRNLRSGTICPFVEMAAITSQVHRVQYTKLREFKGGGSKFQNGDTLFARITPCTENGKTAYVDFLNETELGHGSTEFIILGPKKGVDGKFIYYVAKWDKVRNIAVSKMEGTSGRQRVPSKVFFEDIFVPIPPFSEQKKIAEILKTVDEAIETTDQIIQKTKEIKKGLMQKLLTRGIGHKKFKKTEVGEKPFDWEVGKLSDIADVIMGQPPPGNTYIIEGAGYPILNGPTEFTDYSPIPVQFTTRPTKVCKPHDILFCVRGSSTGRMNIADQEYCIGRGLAAIRKKGISDTRYIYYILLSLASIIFAEASGAGSTFPNISREALEDTKIAIPPRLNRRRSLIFYLVLMMNYRKR